MNLEHLAVRLRPRSDWEAVDLGIALVRADWRRIYAAWTLVMLPLLLLSVATLGGWGLLLFWWLLPLGEVPVLFHTSRAVFGAPPAIRETLRAAPEAWKRAIPELFLRRIHPARCLRLAVGQLERLTGEPRRRRVSVLASVGQGAPGWLPAIFAAFEIGFALAGTVLVVWMLPQATGVDWELAWERFFAGAYSRGLYATVWSSFGLVMLLFHPFHLVAGFALYLDRRTVLEGWDLEIVFRRLARRLREEHGLRAHGQGDESGDPGTGGETAAAVGVLVSFAALLLAFAAPVLAQEPATETSVGAPVESPAEQSAPIAPASWAGDPSKDPRRLAREIASRPEFDRQTTETRWRLRENLADRFASDDAESPNAPFLAGLGSLIALLARPLMWLLAIGLLVVVAIAIWRRLPDTSAIERPSPSPPERLAGLDVRPESLPDDIPAAAEALWRRGDVAAALSLLYRGALARLGSEGLELRESFTEDDCLRVARRVLTSERGELFTTLTRAWQRVAYAHRVPEDEIVRRLLDAWAAHFGPGSAPRTEAAT